MSENCFKVNPVLFSDLSTQVRAHSRAQTGASPCQRRDQQQRASTWECRHEWTHTHTHTHTHLSVQAWMNTHTRMHTHTHTHLRVQAWMNTHTHAHTHTRTHTHTHTRHTCVLISCHYKQHAVDGVNAALPASPPPPSPWPFLFCRMK